MIVEVEGLRKAFGSTPVLTGVDLAVPEGTVLRHPGSRTARARPPTVRILTTLLRPDGGTRRGRRATTSSREPRQVRGRDQPRPASPRRSTSS